MVIIGVGTLCAMTDEGGILSAEQAWVAAACTCYCLVESGAKTANCGFEMAYLNSVCCDLGLSPDQSAGLCECLDGGEAFNHGTRAWYKSFGYYCRG